MTMGIIGGLTFTYGDYTMIFPFIYRYLLYNKFIEFISCIYRYKSRCYNWGDGGYCGCGRFSGDGTFFLYINYFRGWFPPGVVCGLGSTYKGLGGVFCSVWETVDSFALMVPFGAWSQRFSRVIFVPFFLADSHDYSTRVSPTGTSHVSSLECVVS